MLERGDGRQGLQRRAIVCLLSSWLVLGIAHIALLPPWEGFDETAHYSYVQQLVETRRIPNGPSARMSRLIQRYASLAPMPFGLRGRWTYESFFTQAAPVQTTARAFIHDRPREPRQFAPTGERNWQVQHPPLYYLLIAPAYVATRGASLAAHLFTLRVLSYFFAWLALVIPVTVYLRDAGTPTSEHAINRWPLVATAIWPLLFPVWFPEMARMGNDSLCALLLSLVWWRTARRLDQGPSASYAVETGVLLGLGCLTKAFFVPVAGALSVFWIVRGWRLGGFGGARRNACYVAGFVLLAAAIAAWWYVESWSVFQPALTSELTGGLLSGLRRNFSFTQAVRGFAAYGATVSWLGTWSFVRPPYGSFVPMIALAFIGLASYIAVVRRHRPVDLAWLPIWIASPVLLFLAYYVLLRLALTGAGRISVGHYVHVMVAPLAFAMGIGIGSWWGHPGVRRTLLALILYALVFSTGVSWAQVLLFSGQLTKSPAQFYRVVSPLAPMLGIPEAMNRLAVLGYPRVGMICWVGGAMLVVAGLKLIWQGLQGSERGAWSL